MEKSERGQWGSRLTFILAAVGSAVGLGNAWRFPGLAAKHGGGTFLMVYGLMMLVLGIPLLMMEISIGRKTKSGAISSMGAINKKAQWIGWSATTNAFGIVTYYAAVFGWVIMMAVLSFKFAGMTGDTAEAGNLWMKTIKTTGTTEGFSTISTPVLHALLVSWGFIYYCIRNGANSVGKVVKFTVFTPVVCLLIMAIKGICMPGGPEGLAKLFTPDFSQLKDSSLWIDACGQVFYSLSIMMAIMFAYGSYLKEDSNIASDAVIIAFSDLLTSVLAGIVMFTTMGGVGMLDNMSDSGVSTAFIIYPQAIVSLTSSGIFNAIFAFIFYVCLCTLAIDSAFSIVEGVSASISDKFRLNAKKTTLTICIIAGAISVIYTTSAGLAVLDIVDYFSNSINLVLIGVFETLAVGWFFKTTKILEEINRNTKKFKMPKIWFNLSVKIIAPLLLIGFFAWNLYSLIRDSNGLYGGYPAWANIVFGWGLTALVFLSGFVAILIEKRQKKSKGYDVKSWDEYEAR